MTAFYSVLREILIILNENIILRTKFPIFKTCLKLQKRIFELRSLSEDLITTIEYL